MRDNDTNNSKGFAFINFASFDAADAALEAMNGQYLCNRPITISYAFKKDSKGERHGTEAERFLAAQNPLPQAERPHQLFADAPPSHPVPANVGVAPPMMGGINAQMMSGMGMGMGGPPMPPMYPGDPPMPPFGMGFPPGLPNMQFQGFPGFPPMGGLNPMGFPAMGPPMPFAPNMSQGMLRPQPPPPPPPSSMNQMTGMVPPPPPPVPPPPPPPPPPRVA